MKGKPMALKTRKVSSTDTEGFNETVKFEVLHCGNVQGNNNKFYCLEIQKHSNGQYRLFSHYGRLNKTNMYDVRENSNANLNDFEKEFEKIIKKKMRGKKIKEKDGSTREEKYTKVETVQPTVGSPNICNKSKTVDKDVGIDTSAYTCNEVNRILEQFIKENIHNITSKTSLTFTSNGFETPLGPVTKEHVQKARKPLQVLRKKLRKDNTLNKKLESVQIANNEYFSLIPHVFGHKITENDWILDGEKLEDEMELLDQLETAVTLGANANSAKNNLEKLGTEIELLEDKKEIARIKDYYLNSRASNHRQIFGYKIKNIFKIKIPEERKRYEQGGKPLGNIQEVFHGSRNCNLLSILKGGLIVPPTQGGNFTIAGRMFGNGVYGAVNSTKALNYSVGYWTGDSNKYPNKFLFLADFAMGKTQILHSHQYHGADKGYDSVWAKAGRALYNDELIVYDLKQQTLKYLIELEE